MLGLPGFVLLGVGDVGGELEQTVETFTDEVGCTGCGSVARLHDRRLVRVRDLPAGGRPVVLAWRKRVWRCVEPACPVSTWSEQCEQIRPRAVLTERARLHACERVGRQGHTVAQVAADLGVGWATVMAAVREYGQPLVNDPGRLSEVVAIGVDETAFQAASARRSTTFATGIVDLTGPRARLLDVVSGRSATALSCWIAGQTTGFRDGITVAVLDPYRGYARALTLGLPAAVRVLDAFHLVRLGFAAVDDVRRRVQQDSYGHRGRRDEPLYGIRRLLRRRADHLSPHAWDRLLAGLSAGDRDEQIGKAWIAAQDLRLLLQRSRDRPDAAQRLHRWLTFCADAGVPELHRLARTVDSWRAELLAYFETGKASNGPTEAVNLLIKKIKRSGHGFRNFDNYRLRLLLNCGVEWNTPPTARIRGRLPRLAA